VMLTTGLRVRLIVSRCLCWGQPERAVAQCGSRRLPPSSRRRQP
jgi:hypothetical protein